MSFVKALVICLVILVCFIVALGGGPNHVRNRVLLLGESWCVRPVSEHTRADWKASSEFGPRSFSPPSPTSALELVGAAFGETPDPRKNRAQGRPPDPCSVSFCST